MVAFFAIATSVLLALSSVLAEPISTTPSALFSRQVSANIPTDCLTNQCKPYYDTVGALYQNNCLSADCRCTTDVATKAKTCAQCIIDANLAGSFNQTAAQNDFDGYLKTCANSGHPISGVTSFGGGSASAPATTPTTKGNSGAIAQMSTSILGAVLAVVVGGIVYT